MCIFFRKDILLKNQERFSRINKLFEKINKKMTGVQILGAVCIIGGAMIGELVKPKFLDELRKKAAGDVTVYEKKPTS